MVGKLGKAECLRGMKKYDEALKLFDEIIFATNDVAAYDCDVQLIHVGIMEEEMCIEQSIKLRRL